MKKYILKSILITASIITLMSCKDDDAIEVINEEELITTVEYTLSSTAGNVVLKSVDLDGDGPSAPVITTTGTLRANTTYVGSVRFLNESISPSEDITAEVFAEGVDHEVFYADNAGVTITKTDTDSNGNPLGLRSNFVTTTAGSGNLTIVLKHEPRKPNNGTLANAGGDTDVEQIFSITIN